MSMIFIRQFKKKAQNGFSLIELVIYMGVFSILVMVLSTVFAQIVGVQLESEATAAVDQDGRFLMSRLLYDMKSATAINTPASLGVSSPTMQILVNGITYTYSLNAGGNLQVVNNYGTNMLNSFDSQISGLTFTRIGSGGSNDTVRVNFTVTSRTRKMSGTGVESRSFQTTLGRDYRQ